MKLIDANVILRYLLNDNEEMANQAKKIVQNGCFVTTEVIAEVIYVLRGVYKVNKSDIKNFMMATLNDIKCENPNLISTALDLYEKNNLDFVDCVLIAYNHVFHYDIFSFDKKLISKLKK